MEESSQEEAIANDISTSRLRLGEIGSEAISVIQEITQRLTPVELKYPQYVDQLLFCHSFSLEPVTPSVFIGETLTSVTVVVIFP